jgi:hypothetical protein
VIRPAAFDILDLPLVLPVLRVEFALQDREEPGLEAGAWLEPVAPVTRLKKYALHQVFRAIHVMGEQNGKGPQMTGDFQEVLNEVRIMRIPADPNGTLQASDQLDQLWRQMGGDEVGIDATQLLSQMLSDRIAMNNGVGWPELGASHEEEMMADLHGINLIACGKLTQPLARPVQHPGSNQPHRS